MNRKELLTENRLALAFLHNEMRFDFERDCIIIKGVGRFTYNSVCKEIAQRIPGEYVAAVLMKRERPYRNDDELYFVRVGCGRFLNDRVRGYSYHIDDFYTVGDFEEARKTQTAHYYIIAQSVEYLTEPKQEKGVDLSQRFRYIPYKYEKHGDGKGHTYIGEVHLMKLDGSAQEFTFKPYEGIYIPGEAKAATVSEVIDKSGYLVIERRRKLARGAKALRAEREKAAAASADFSQRETAIAKGLEELKRHVSEMVLTANTNSDGERAEKACRTMRWALYYFERYNERKAAGRFNSIKEAEGYLADIEKKISEGMEE